MGAMQRLNEKALTVKRETRSASRYTSEGAMSSDVPWSIGDTSDGLLADTIAAVLGVGDAISFYAARTGGAVCISILSGDERFKFWCATINEAEERLKTIQSQARMTPASGPQAKG